MRAHVTFDTLDYMDELKRSGMKVEEAEAITRATAKAFTQMMELKEVATKSDFKQLEGVLKSDISQVKIELMKFVQDNNWRAIGILATFQTVVLGVFGILQYCIK